MTKTLLHTLLAVALSGILFTSCKREKKNILPSAKEYLSGTWQVTYYAYDDNNNKMLDDREKEASDEELDFTFYPNGSGNIHSHNSYYPGNSDDQAFSWSFRNNDKEIVMVIRDEYYTEKFTAKINQLDGHSLVLETNNDYGYEEYIQWIFFEKKN